MVTKSDSEPTVLNMQPFTNTTLSLSVFSGKGGVGKSSLCANLGFCLGEMGHSCLLMDCDLGLANLDVLLGVTSGATLHDLLSNGAEARDILLPLTAGVDLIPAASGVPELVEMDSKQRAFLLQKLQPVLQAYDFLILDLAAGLSGTVLALAQAASRRLLVLTPEATSLTDAYAMIKVLAAKNGASDFLVLVNQVKNREEARQTFSRLDNAVRKFLGFGTTFLGMIHEDPNMGLAVLRQQPLVRLAGQSPAARDIRVVAQRIQSLRNALLPEIARAPAIKNF